MTIQQTKARIRQLGLTCRYDSATGEFRVNLRPQDGGTDDTAYYTDDRQDALDTAQAMVVGRYRAENAREWQESCSNNDGDIEA